MSGTPVSKKNYFIELLEADEASLRTGEAAATLLGCFSPMLALYAYTNVWVSNLLLAHLVACGGWAVAIITGGLGALVVNVTIQKRLADFCAQNQLNVIVYASGVLPVVGPDMVGRLIAVRDQNELRVHYYYSESEVMTWQSKTFDEEYGQTPAKASIVKQGSSVEKGIAELLEQRCYARAVVGCGAGMLAVAVLALAVSAVAIPPVGILFALGATCSFGGFTGAMVGVLNMPMPGEMGIFVSRQPEAAVPPFTADRGAVATI